MEKASTHHDPLKLMFVCGGSYVSGAEIVSLSVMSGLQERGHQIRCISNSWNDGDFANRLDEANINHQEIPVGNVSTSIKPKYIWWTLNALFHLPLAWVGFWLALRDFQPDVVIFNSFVSASLLRPFLGDQQVVFYAHDFPSSSRHFKYCLSTGATYIAVSKFIEQGLIEHGVSPTSITVAHNGVREVNGRPAHDISDRPVRLGIIGQIGKWKGHDDLIEALRFLNTKNSTFECHIVGRGDEEYTQSLRKRIDRYDLTDKIVWRGYQTDMEPVYRELDVLVVPSRCAEAFGLVAAEAGIYGLPAIVTSQGGLPEIIEDGVTGYIIDSESPSQIASRLSTLIAHPDVRKEIGMNARERVTRHFTTTNMIDNVESTLFRLV